MELQIDDANLTRRRYTSGNGTLTTAGAGVRSLRVVEAYEARAVPERRVEVFPKGGVHVVDANWTAIVRFRHGFNVGAVPIIARWKFDFGTSTPSVSFKSRILVGGKVLKEVTHTIRIGSRLSMNYGANEDTLGSCAIGCIYWQEDGFETVEIQVEKAWATQLGVSRCKDITVEIG